MILGFHPSGQGSTPWEDLWGGALPKPLAISCADGTFPNAYLTARGLGGGAPQDGTSLAPQVP